MKLFTTTATTSCLLAASSICFANASITTTCKEICEVPLDMSCSDAIARNDFGGDCCSLRQEVDGNCALLTTSDCYFQGKGDTGYITDEEGIQARVVPGNAYVSFSRESCPDSEFDIQMMPAGTNADAGAGVGEGAASTTTAMADASGGEASKTFTADSIRSAETPPFMLHFASFVLLLLQTTWDLLDSMVIEV